MRMPKPLTGSVLSRLAAEALATYLGQAELFVLAMHPGCCLVLSGEPVADMNYLVAGRGAADGDHFAAAFMSGISRGLPFLAIVFPEAGDSVERTAGHLGLVHIVGAIRRRTDPPPPRIPTALGAISPRMSRSRQRATCLLTVRCPNLEAA